MSSLQHDILQPFESSPFLPSGNFDSDFDVASTWPQKTHADNSSRFIAAEKEPSAKESNIAKIKVVVCQDIVMFFNYNSFFSSI